MPVRRAHLRRTVPLVASAAFCIGLGAVGPSLTLAQSWLADPACPGPPSVTLVVVDGDTVALRVAPDYPEHVLRLDGIDAPELAQPGGVEAAEHLASAIRTLGRSAGGWCVVARGSVAVDPEADPYGRPGLGRAARVRVDRVAVDGLAVPFSDLAYVQVAAGWAFAVDCTEGAPYAGAQADAREARAGLWSVGTPSSWANQRGVEYAESEVGLHPAVWRERLWGARGGGAVRNPLRLPGGDYVPR